MSAPSKAVPVDRASVGLRSERGPVLLSLMVAMSVVALDSTIIATAVPSVVASLGGLSQFPWLFSAYLLAQAISIPIYGKYADVIGRKPIVLTGIALFLIGSIGAGVAWDMTALIVFRAVQGLGAGAVQPMSMTIVGDLYTLRERAKVQGYLASVWGMSAVVGPALGGVFSEWVSWRWIFLINIPLCLLAGWMLWARLHEKVQPRDRKPVDLGGAFLLTIGCGLIVLGLLEGGQSWAWGSPVGIGVFVVGAVLLVVFGIVERHAADPVLPLWVIRRPLLVSAGMTSLVLGAVTLGFSSYIPTFAQTSLGAGPLAAGFALATLTIGWPIAASLAGRMYLRLGFRVTALIGATIAVIGTGLTLTLDIDASLWHIAAFCFVIGLGLGWVANPTLISAQNSVGWSDRGVVTGTNMFARSLGSAIGVAIFGAAANSVLDGRTDGPAVADATWTVLLLVAIFAVIMLVSAFGLPKRADTVERANA
ncbi:MFS transporter [Nakamurella sp. YIM 132087]|uniref:MFS transporter n=1 Tax=Nakamurella alba TaxID=2665158 RepID=A0A7K1FRP3_9ACTN|nr:MDR family MFS transporter [Nakamurella alba]MTD16817.1 MFS transporter [Nakamurella alba]